MKKFTPILSIVLFLLILPMSSNATIFKAIASSDWHLTSTWDQVDKVPGSLDTVIIDGFDVTFDNNAGNVIISRLEINNSSDHASLTIEGDNSFIVSNNLEVIAYDIDKNVDLIVQGTVNFNVRGHSIFERVVGNDRNKRLKLHLLGSAIMTVNLNFTYNYNDAKNDEGNDDILLEGSSKLNILGNTYLNCHGGNELMCDLKGSSELTISGNLLMNKTAGGNFMVGSSSEFAHFQINGNAVLTNSGGTGYFALGADIKSGSLTVNGNVNLISSTAGKMAMLASSGPSAIVEIKGNISMSAVSDNDAKIYMDDESTLKLGGLFERPTNYGMLIMDNTSTLIFNGSDPQIVPPTKLENTGNDSLFITNLSLKNTSSSPLTLQGDLRVNDILLLNKGNIITHDTAMLYIEGNAIISGGSDTSYIEGPMVKIGASQNEPFTFPIGDANNYAPLTITPDNSDISAEYEAQYYSDPPPFGVIHSSINNTSSNEYWELTKSSGAPAADLTLSWYDAAAQGINDLDDLVVAGLTSGDGWKSYGNGGTTGTTGTNGSGTIINSLASDPPPFGVIYFTYGSTTAMNALPVELTSFQAIQQNSHAFLQWETASERNTSHFSIERSTNGFDFKEIGSVQGSGDGVIAHHYNFKDITPENGINYYRLKIVDHDNTFEYSNIEVINFQATPTIQLFPNPVKKVIQLEGFDSNINNAQLEIFDKNGRIIFSSLVSVDDGKLNISTDLANIHETGTYFLRIISQGQSHVLKFIKLAN